MGSRIAPSSMTCYGNTLVVRRGSNENTSQSICPTTDKTHVDDMGCICIFFALKWCALTREDISEQSKVLSARHSSHNYISRSHIVTMSHLPSKGKNAKLQLPRNCNTNPWQLRVFAFGRQPSMPDITTNLQTPSKWRLDCECQNA